MSALQERQKTIVDMLNLPDAVLSMMSSSKRPESRNSLFKKWGPKTPTLLDATIMDILHIKQMGDEDYMPSQFVCGGCDPAIPLLIDTVEMGWMTSHSTPYMHREWSTTWCGDEKMLKRAMLSEMVTLPWGRKLNMNQKQNLLLMAADRQMQGEMRAGEMRMWLDDFLSAKAAISGPGIPKNTVLDMQRKKELFVKLDGDGWANNSASRVETIRALFDYGYEHSGDNQSYGNVVLMDKVAKAMFFKGVEFTECDPCGGSYNPNVSRPGSNLQIPGERADDMKGLKRLVFSDDVLSDVEFWCLDEMRTECVLDADGKETGEKRKVPVLQPGTMIIFNENNHAPIALHGKIQRNNIDAPMFRYTRRIPECCGNDKIGIESETAPLYFNRRENTILTVYVAPETCPPPKHQCPVPFACDPEGGNKVVAASLSQAAITANIMAEAAVKQANSQATTKKIAESDAKPTLGLKSKGDK